MFYKYGRVWPLSDQNVFCVSNIYHAEKLRHAVEIILLYLILGHHNLLNM